MKDNKYVSIFIETIDQLKKILKDKRYNNFAIKIVNDLIMVTGLKQEKTKTSGGEKPPRISNRQILEQILKRLDNVEDILKRHNQILERHDQMFDYVLDVFKHNNLK